MIADIDLAELCITSSAKVIFDDGPNIIVNTKKAMGNKCPVCWKITEEACPKHSE